MHASAPSVRVVDTIGAVELEVVMNVTTPSAMWDDRDEAREKRAEEIDWTLQAIAGAIAAGKLPPDDAFAWARIAAREAEVQVAKPVEL
jgi:hypothetical protein